ncbi:hypothetical protein J4H92_06680 [Leucobacter weissii]|uniref:Bacterial SCP orthologue domain-containing protein n=1 Tax=Leucobacter weissii TaxID=1983706 RepID=A0A939MJD5_9MICO|nr:sterol carrier family protein [Leucobacter weissii]MBO1901636.1 hypothetical protein [Leucobacter weissii]
MARRRIDTEAGIAAVRAAAEGDESRATVAAATRFLLEELAERAPGNALEVRVPPYGATQCLPGPRHTRGTPPGVVETDPASWIALATGGLSWAEALEDGRVAASGVRADLGMLLPLLRLPGSG